MSYQTGGFAKIYRGAEYNLRNSGRVVHNATWQGRSVKEDQQAFEIMNYQFSMPMYGAYDKASAHIRPTQPWADMQFAERVSGVPHNPGPSYFEWPGFKTRDHSEEDKFLNKHGQADHTYAERMWPNQVQDHEGQLYPIRRQGRFKGGDLDDLVNLLMRDPYTRQAYLPIWFPEDTGATENQRVPCSLGYHFMIREYELHCNYFIRSCDLFRHFRNDVYFANCLTLWLRERLSYNVIMCKSHPSAEVLSSLGVGNLHFFASSLHCFAGDAKARRWIK